MTPDVIRAHRHCKWHREEVLASELCGCFYCCETFPPSEIKEWWDESVFDGIGQTAICPRCEIDAVIGSESGYPLTSEFLKGMHLEWFEK